jgi:hypothetical protein
MLETLLAIIGSPVVSNLLITVVGALLTYVFGKVGTNILSDQKKKIAREIVMMAVSQLADVAKTYKATSGGDKKLTAEQQQTLTNNAISNAQEIGKNAGIDVVKTLGPEGAELAVKLAVKALKSVVERKIPALPADVEKNLP